MDNINVTVKSKNPAVEPKSLKELTAEIAEVKGTIGDIYESVEQSEQDVERLNEAYNNSDDFIIGPDNKMKRKPKAYAPAEYSGLGEIYLDKNMKFLGREFEEFVSNPNVPHPGTSIGDPDGIVYDRVRQAFLGYRNIEGSRMYTDTWDEQADYTAASGYKYLCTSTETAYKWQNGDLVETAAINGNVLTQAMLDFEHTIYHIQYDYDLNGRTIEVPDGCGLQFDGGSLINGTVVGQNTTIVAGLVKIFGDNLIIQGSWNIAGAYPEWFGSLNKCITYFHKAVLTGIYEISEPIVCDNEHVGYSIRFEAGSKLSPSDDYSYDYLITASPADYTVNRPSQEIQDISITGENEAHVDLKGLCAFLYADAYHEEGDDKRARHVAIADIKIVNAWNNAERDVHACITTFNSVRIVNCEFLSSRIDPSKDFNCMVAVWWSDSTFDNIVIVNSKSGILCGDSSFLTNIHVWGAPDKAIILRGGCLISNLYGDWAAVGVDYIGPGNETVTIDNYYLIASRDPESEFYYDNCIVFRTNNKNIHGYVSYIPGIDGTNPIPLADANNNPIKLEKIAIYNKGNLKATIDNGIFANYNPYSVYKSESGYNIVWFKFCKMIRTTFQDIVLKYYYSNTTYNIYLRKDELYYMVIDMNGRPRNNTVEIKIEEGSNNEITIYVGLRVQYARIMLDKNEITYSAVSNLTFFGEKIPQEDVSQLDNLTTAVIMPNIDSQLPAKAPFVGFQFFNTTDGKVYYVKSLADDLTPTWVDALGNPVSTVYPKVIGTPTSGNLAKFNNKDIEDAGVAPQV